MLPRPCTLAKPSIIGDIDYYIRAHFLTNDRTSKNHFIANQHLHAAVTIMTHQAIIFARYKINRANNWLEEGKPFPKWHIFAKRHKMAFVIDRFNRTVMINHDGRIQQCAIAAKSRNTRNHHTIILRGIANSCVEQCLIAAGETSKGCFRPDHQFWHHITLTRQVDEPVEMALAFASIPFIGLWYRRLHKPDH